MQAYDPSVDPRYIPPDRRAEREAAELQDELAENERAMHEVGTMLALFEHPGWEMVASKLQNERASAQAQLGKVLDGAEWKLLRGQLLAVEMFLALPDRVRGTQRVLEGEHTRLTEEERDVTGPDAER